ncbi:MAG TPA: M23 family metallopeptidase [Solirubrobacteraceae bacterium]|nr:M23 family metallopeptidase [Solirubrobacteraceae bacterium]
MLAMTAATTSCATAPIARADAAGGAQAPSHTLTGGSEYGVTVAIAARTRPRITRFSVPATSVAGAPPRVTLRIDEPHVGTVNAQVVVISIALHKRALTANLGWVHTGRTVVVRWPRRAKLTAGAYQVSLRAHDHHHATLARRAHTSGTANLTVTPRPAPAPAQPAPAPLTPLPVGAPTPAQTAGATFPVVGAHSFGNADNRFGAGRAGHTHQGQDILAAQGLPVVAPLAGTITTTGYQASGAGYYAVEHASNGFDFFFAHCTAGSLAVSPNQPVTAAQPVCAVGQTGDATAPHLHFEIWVGGWHAAGGQPIDPLPYLQAWDTSR